MENKINVAIIGLGRVGSIFIKKLTGFENRGVSIVAVTETNPDSIGLQYAKQRGIRICREVREITEMRDKVDVIFNLTGNPKVERDMRLAQVKLDNIHTIIVSRVMADLLWRMISEETLPEHTRPLG